MQTVWNVLPFGQTSYLAVCTFMDHWRNTEGKNSDMSI